MRVARLKIGFSSGSRELSEKWQYLLKSLREFTAETGLKIGSPSADLCDHLVTVSGEETGQVSCLSSDFSAPLSGNLTSVAFQRYRFASLRNIWC